MSLNTTIDVSEYGISSDDIGDIYNAMVNRHPELFFLSEMSYSHLRDDKAVIAIKPVYSATAKELPDMMACYNAELDRIAAYAAPATTPLCKALMVNDYFCVNYAYDKGYTVYDALGLFTRKTGVCKAFTLGYMAAMKRLGIPCEAASTKEHAWNLIRIDGHWYHVDVTDNNTVSGMALMARHDHFMRSDAGLENHDPWQAAVKAESARYDGFFWRSVKAPIPVCGDTMYYVDPGDDGKTRCICSRKAGSSSSRKLHEFEARWYNFDNPGKYWPGYYGLLGIHQGRLLYGTPEKIYSIALDGRGPRRVFAPDTSSGYIYYGCVCNGLMRFHIGKTPYESEKTCCYAL